MRVTNGMLVNTFKRNINNNLSRVADYQMQMQTGKRIVLLSDDPVGAVSIMQAKSKLYRIEQYKRNTEDARDWLMATESAVRKLSDLVGNVYEKTVGASTDVNGATEKQAFAEYVKQMRDDVVPLMNTTSASKYLFGGYSTLKAPFTVDAGGNLLYNGKSLETGITQSDLDQIIEYPIGDGLRTQINYTGPQILGSGADNLYKILDDLYNVLASDASIDQINQYIDPLLKHQERLLAITAEIGGLDNRLETMISRYEDDYLNYKEIQSRIEDVDEAEAITNFNMANYVYNAALKAGAMIIQNTLMDYLR